jgi:hypothetical protein
MWYCGNKDETAVGDVASTEQNRNAHRMLVGKTENKDTTWKI